ncbi:MAG: penicillin-binding protein 2 [Bacilli bacterium]|nr:penicillin-binding protein 2 [Bacilli bacterium]
MNNRFKLLIILNIILFCILFLSLFNIQVINYKKYKDIYDNYSNKIVYGDTSPRGNIYDRYGRVIVTNKPLRTIVYKKNYGVTLNDEIKIAYKLSSILDIDYSKVTDEIIKNFWIKKNPKKARNKILESELEKYRYRKITGSDIENLKISRVKDEELKEFGEIDKKAAYIYYLMNKGYSYSEKIIKDKGVTDEEYALISANIKNLNGVNTKVSWERYYPYGNVFKSMLGSVSSSSKGIPKEYLDYYLKKGYSMNDRVGTSYIEYMYDDILKGDKSSYRIKKDNSLELIQSGSKGNDIYLTIDIELQKEVEKILEEEIIKAKKEANTTYYNKSFVVITEPSTGEVLAMSGKQINYINDDVIFYDYTPGVFTFSFAVGSAIKGASHIVGYNTGALTLGEKRYDTCVKLKSAPIKCSWKYLGLLDDLNALKWSSNTYQFYTAFKVADTSYFYDMPFQVNNNAFDIYRNTFSEFGLGVKTGLDVPNESTGLRGLNDKSGLLLDFAIGQYDNYTPLQLSQYISTIANNGNRMKYHLLKKYIKNNKTIEIKPVILNKVNTNSIYLDRVKEGFKMVMHGTGAGYINLKYDPAGKTGTSQSFIDTDNNGLIDKETVSNTFVGFAPFNNPVVTFTVVSPDTYDYSSSFESYVNRRISRRISEKYFEIYK